MKARDRDAVKEMRDVDKESIEMARLEDLR